MKTKEIGNQIRYYRKKLNFTQQQLADKIGVTWEMVSRYERGNSSPLSKLDTIADALKVSTTSLMQKDTQGKIINNGVNLIPLFTAKPSNSIYTEENTSYFYNAPDWIIKKDNKAIAIDPRIIDSIKTVRLVNDGVIYIAPSIEPVAASIIVFFENDKMIADTFSNQKYRTEILGVVIAQEVRL